MMPVRRRTIFVPMLLLAVLTAPGAAQNAPLDRLQAELERLAGTSGGTLGITAIHLESGVEATSDVPTRERAIAQVTRAVYDYFLFTATP